MTAGKKFLKDLNEMLREKHEAQKEYWNELTEPAWVAWEGRTWWLRRRKWKYIFQRLTPDVSGAFGKLRRYIDSAAVWQEMQAISSGSIYFDRIASRKLLPTVIVWFNIRNDLMDIEEPMEEMLANGWEVDDTDDSSWRRRYTLSHPEHDCTVLVIAQLRPGSSCEVIEHEEEVTETKTRHEIVCAGEAELTGRAS